jgi:hypothetical protein
VEDASKLAATVETNNLKPIVHIAAVTREDDDTVHLVAVTGGGARFYISTRYRESGTKPTINKNPDLHLDPLQIKIRIRIRIKVISWIRNRICINLQMTSNLASK